MDDSGTTDGRVFMRIENGLAWTACPACFGEDPACMRCDGHGEVPGDTLTDDEIDSIITEFDFTLDPDNFGGPFTD